MDLAEAVVGLQAYKEVDERMEQLWRNLDGAIVAPRMNRLKTPSHSVKVEGNTLALDSDNDLSIDALLLDLEKVFGFLAEKLPEDLLISLCGFMMADIVPRLVREWLMVAVPSSLTDMSNFQDMIRRSKQFCIFLQERGYTQFSELTDWVNKAHMSWLDKCRETALNTVRTNLVKGIRSSKTVEKVEKHMVSVSEGRELATTGAAPAADVADWNDDWGDDWDNDQNTEGKANSSLFHQQNDNPPPPDEGAEDWGWGDEGGESKETGADANDEFDEDWGWGDEEATTNAPPPNKLPAKPQSQQTSRSKSQPKTQQQKQLKGQTKSQARVQTRPEKTRELILKETYNISSMPEPVLDLIFAILEDGATLTRGAEEHQLVASTAPGLFSLPTFALALFRAISPYYYSLDVGGSM